MKGHAAIVEMLVSASTAIDRRTNLGETALIAAAHNGHVEVVKALLAAGAAVD
jgi:ankyrin repeat protein